MSQHRSTAIVIAAGVCFGVLLGPAPAASAENRELGKKIGEALAGLGEDQRMVFVLREYEGLEYAAIAEVMGVSEGTVKSRLHRAKQALRNRLSPYLAAGTQ